MTRNRLGAFGGAAALALSLAAVAGRPLVGHGGNAPGQCTQFGALTDTPYTIVVLSNLTILTCHPVTEEVLRLLPSAKAPSSSGPAYPTLPARTTHSTRRRPHVFTS